MSANESDNDKTITNLPIKEGNWNNSYWMMRWARLTVRMSLIYSKMNWKLQKINEFIQIKINDFCCYFQLFFFSRSTRQHQFDKFRKIGTSITWNMARKEYVSSITFISYDISFPHIALKIMMIHLLRFFLFCLNISTGCKRICEAQFHCQQRRSSIMDTRIIARRYQFHAS